MARPIVVLIFEKRLCECPGENLEWRPYLGGTNIWGLLIICSICKTETRLSRSDIDTGIEYSDRSRISTNAGQEIVKLDPEKITHSKELTAFDKKFLRSMKIEPD